MVQFGAFASNLPFRRTKYFSQHCHCFSVALFDVLKCQYEENLLQRRILFQKMVLIRGTRCSEVCRGAMGQEALGTANQLRAKGALCDAVLRTEDGGSFPIHRMVLLMHSDFFRFVCLRMYFTNVRRSDITRLQNVADLNWYVQFYVLCVTLH
jgi:hypothetical protein